MIHSPDMRQLLTATCLFMCTLAWSQTPSVEVSTTASAHEVEQARQLREALQHVQKLPLHPQPFPFQTTSREWGVGNVSSVRVDAKGLIYVFQRGNQADPILAFEKDGRLVRSWGKGLFKVPHTIRFDSDGNLWAVDAGNSNVFKFSPSGEQLLEINVGEVPQCDFPSQCGASDIAFGPNGRIFISDGYGNARILEYSKDGRRVRQFGGPGTGPGQFHLVHSLVIKDKILYVADRDNDRVQRFDLEGKFLSEWNHLGKPFSLDLLGNILWIGTGYPDQPVLRGGQRPPGWLLKVDVSTGKILGYVESNSAHHFIEATRSGDVMSGSTPDGFAWFRK
jgi:hypothetical protein